MYDANWREQFKKGTLTDGWRYFGAHQAKEFDQKGWRFRVWAPKAKSVSVVGDFNKWDAKSHPMHVLQKPYADGIWEIFIAELPEFTAYKYAITGENGKTVLKADPYAFHAESRPGTASKLYDLGGYANAEFETKAGYAWGDWDFVKARGERKLYDGPLNIYEVHLGSWRTYADGNHFDYASIGQELADYVSDMGYNAVEFLPLTEYPLDASWGYQCTGYFAATSRYGTPDGLKKMIDTLHQAGIVVILDWVPSHFCKDEFGLIDFDGSSCYEYEDPKKREHYGWGTRVFDFGRPEVISFLCSSARYWLDEFHADGLRVDAVASMLYLNYDRSDGNWTANKYGGQENLEAVEFLRTLNKLAFKINPGVIMAAEESTAWPGVTKPAELGGLGFNFKWNMGWMNNLCRYLKMDPFFRKDNHNLITFNMMYAFSENFVLPISHDEVVHMKGSLVNKMPGAYEDQLKWLRSFYLFMLCHPGKKLLFMGPELGQWNEWKFEGQLDWDLLSQERNRRNKDFFKAMNHLYLKSSELWENDLSWEGFEWLIVDDTVNNTVAFARKNKKGERLICVINFSPTTIPNYRVPVPPIERYVPVLNSDDYLYGGSNYGDKEPIQTEWVAQGHRQSSIMIQLPARGGLIFRPDGGLLIKPTKKPFTRLKGVLKVKKKIIQKKKVLPLDDTSVGTLQKISVEEKLRKQVK